LKRNSGVEKILVFLRGRNGKGVQGGGIPPRPSVSPERSKGSISLSKTPVAFR